MGIKLKQFVFALDRPPVYTAGELVTGYCLIGLDGQMNLDQLVITLEGVAHCRWTESYTVSTTGSNGKSTTRTQTRTVSSTSVFLDLNYNPGRGNIMLKI